MNEDYKNAITQSTYLSEIGADDSSSDDSIYDPHAKQDYSFKEPDESTDDSDTDIDSQDVTSRKEDQSTHDSETDGSIDDGDVFITTELSFNEADLTIPFKTPYAQQVVDWESKSWIVFEPLASQQVVNVQHLIILLKFMILNTTPTDTQIKYIQRTWDIIMGNYKTIEQRFRVYYNKLLGVVANGHNVFEQYVHFLLGYKIDLKKLEEYYQEWLDMAMSQQDRLKSEQDGLRLQQNKAMLQQAAITTPAQQVPAETHPARQPHEFTTPEPQVSQRAPPQPRAERQDIIAPSQPGGLPQRQGNSLRSIGRAKAELKQKASVDATKTKKTVESATTHRNNDMENAGLGNLMQGEHIFTQKLENLKSRRSDLMDSLRVCVSRMSSTEFDKVSLQSEIVHFDDVMQQSNKMFKDIEIFIRSALKIDGMKIKIQAFQTEVTADSAAVTTLSAQFNRAKTIRLTHLNKQQSK